MRFVIAHTYYQPFLDNFYAHRNTRKLDFDKTQKAITQKGFGIGDAYSYNLRQMGHEAIDLIMNDPVLIRLWLRKYTNNTKLKVLDRLPNFIYRKIIKRMDWIEYGPMAISEQIRSYRPDIVLLRNVKLFPPEWIKNIRGSTRVGVIGQIAYSFDKFEWLKEYDLVLSSLPNLVSYMEKRGIKARYLAHAFYKRMLKKVKKQKRQYDVVFVGGFTQAHLEEIRVLEKIAEQVPLKIWGYGVEKLLPQSSPIRGCYQGEAWGINMFNIYHNAKIVINRHGNVAPVKKLYANNHRLFEATGVGAMLLTDAKDNLHEFFTEGKEIVTYRTAEEAVRKIKYYLSHEVQRKAIAKAGQRRTLRDHSYEQRMREFLGIVRTMPLRGPKVR